MGLPGRTSLARVLLLSVVLSGLALGPHATPAGAVDNRRTLPPGSTTLPVRGPIPAGTGSFVPGQVLVGPGRTRTVELDRDADVRLRGVAFNSGTSFAAPIVSGLLALAGGTSPLLARLAMEASADEYGPGGPGDAKRWAHGLVDAQAFLDAHAPDAPPALVLETTGKDGRGGHRPGSGDGQLPHPETTFRAYAFHRHRRRAGERRLGGRAGPGRRRPGARGRAGRRRRRRLASLSPDPVAARLFPAWHRRRPGPAGQGLALRRRPAPVPGRRPDLHGPGPRHLPAGRALHRADRPLPAHLDGAPRGRPAHPGPGPGPQTWDGDGGPPGGYRLRVLDAEPGSGRVLLSAFPRVVDEQHPRIAAAAAPDPFEPRPHDGDRDTTVFAMTSSEPGRLRVVISGPGGAEVRVLRSGRQRVGWTGRTSSGAWARGRFWYVIEGHRRRRQHLRVGPPPGPGALGTGPPDGHAAARRGAGNFPG
jgi:hypothetical protein